MKVFYFAIKQIGRKHAQTSYKEEKVWQYTIICKGLSYLKPYHELLMNRRERDVVIVAKMCNGRLSCLRANYLRR
jgi:hypothetical protein